MKQYAKSLENAKKKLSEIAKEIVKDVSNVGFQESSKSYQTELLEIKEEDGAVTGGIRTVNEKDTYREFGTGIVGSRNPAVDEYLSEAGWKYDVNEHGEAGWIYPVGNGEYRWTKGLPAEKRFYNATKKMEDRLSEIIGE